VVTYYPPYHRRSVSTTPQVIDGFLFERERDTLPEKSREEILFMHICTNKNSGDAERTTLYIETKALGDRVYLYTCIHIYIYIYIYMYTHIYIHTPISSIDIPNINGQ